MRRLTIAVVIVLAAAAICFAVVRSFPVSEDLAGSIYETALPQVLAGLLLGTITYVHQLVDPRAGRPTFTVLPGTVVSFERYTLPWHVMIVYGVLIVYAASGLGTLTIWAFGQITNLFFSRAIRGLDTLFVCFALYFVGSWIGSRADKHPLISVLAVVVGYKIIATISGLLLESASVLSTALIFATSTLLYLIVALLGLWRGHRVRWLRYLQYLLKFVPKAARQRVINLTYNEVQRLALDHDAEAVPVVQVERAE